MKNGKLKHKPVRMCIICRNRYFQSELNRLQCENNKLIRFSGVKKSFYVCNNCINSKKFINYISKICKTNRNEAKEMIGNFPFFISH